MQVYGVRGTGQDCKFGFNAMTPDLMMTVKPENPKFYLGSLTEIFGLDILG